MALRRNKPRKLENAVFHGVMFTVFVFQALFFVLLLLGLCSYSNLESFMGVLRDPEFHFALKFTLWTSLLATVFATVVALPCAYVTSRYSFFGRSLFDTLLDIPIVLPPLVSGIALLIFFGPFMDKYFSNLGIDVVFSPIGVVVAQWFIATPFAIKSFKQAFSSVDRRHEKVARTLGFSAPSVFWKVTLPLAKNGLIGGVMMAWTRALGEFGATAMLAGITRMKTETLSVAVFLNMSIGDMKFAISSAIVMLLISLTILILVKAFLGNEVKV